MDFPGPSLLSFTITGTGFLRYMVRSIVGTLVDVGKGRMSPAVFPRSVGIPRSVHGRAYGSRSRTLPAVGPIQVVS